MKNLLLFILSVWAVGSVFASEPVRVATTVQPLADWVRLVGGDDVQVTCLLPPGASPHTFDPTPRDMRQAAQTQLFVRVGLDLDNWVTKIAGASSSGTSAPIILDLGATLRSRGQLPDLSVVEPKGRPVVKVAESAADAGHVHSESCTHDEGGSGTDPHFWLNPLLGELCVREIARQLTLVAPDRADRWQRGAEAACLELKTLDEELSATLASAPRKEFACFHDGFKYLAQRYGLIRVAVIEEYPGKTPGDRYLMQVVRDLKRYKITTVFIEPQLSPRVAQILAEEAGAGVAVLDPLGGTAGRETYAKNMRANAAALREAMK